jgi:Protein of unknown function, DUF273/galactosyl transferase GMA12/MNN10 family
MAISHMENPQDPEGTANFTVLIVDTDDECVGGGYKNGNNAPHSTSSSLSSKSDDAFSTTPLPLHLDDSLLVSLSSLQDSLYHDDYNHPQHHPLQEDEEYDNDSRRAIDNGARDGKHESYSSYYPLKRKPSRTLLYLRNRANASNVTIVFFSVLLSVLLVHRLFSLYMTHRQWINAPITYMERPCDAPPYETITSMSRSQTSRNSSSRSLSTGGALLEDDTAAAASASPSQNENKKLNICITTLTDAKSTSKFQRFIRWRNFDGILELTWQNKLDYATKHGYHLVDGSDVIDTSRPPAWSKIPAVQRLLQPASSSSSQDSATAAAAAAAANLPHCDWVMWTDADTVFMNSQRKIEDFLPIATSTHDLLVGSDNGGGYNSGVFLLRNTEWSRQFLNDWWNMTAFVRPPGMSLSGDNHALKSLLAATLPNNNFNDHVLVPSRCTLNAFAKFLTVSESLTVMSTNLNKQPWFLSQDYYHKGDFLAHAPGYDNKAECLRLLLREAR